MTEKTPDRASDTVPDIAKHKPRQTIPAIEAGSNPSPLTREESRFVLGVIRKLDPVEVARTIGYDAPEVMAYHLLGRPHVQAALKARAMRHVFGALLPSALKAHDDILNDASAPPAARMQAVRAVYDLIRLENESGLDTDSVDRRPISERTAAELEELVTAARNKLDKLDRELVDITPAFPASDAQEPDKA